MIRVLHIVPRLDLTGVAKFVLNHFSKIDKSIFTFDFVNHGGGESFHKDLEKENCTIYNLPFPHEIGNKAYFSQLIDVIKKGKYDIIHIHTGHYTGMTALLCKLFSKSSKVICHAHTTKCMNPYHQKLMPFFRMTARIFADKLFACGHEAGVFCFGKHSNFKELHNSVDLELFMNRSEDEIQDLRTSLNIPKDSFVVGHIGAFSPQKNHYYLLKIIYRYLQHNKSAIFVLLGTGPDFKSVVEKSKELGIYENIRFMGVQDDVPLYLSMFDTFVLPSLHEGLPVVSAEAQALGLKTIFSDTIDHTCDLGLGIMKFVSIDESNIEDWCDAIDMPCHKLTKVEIKSVFLEKKYEINSSVNYLQNEYQSLLKC